LSRINTTISRSSCIKKDFSAKQGGREYNVVQNFFFLGGLEFFEANENFIPLIEKEAY